jgi:predicted DNA-binding protein with PD1-like motif
LRNSIQSFVKERNIQAGWIVSCAGSLAEYSIRFANQPGATKGSGHFEIVSLTGTVSVNGSDLHIGIYTTAEIV